MIDSIVKLLQQNQFASGGLLVVVVGAVLAYLRSMPSYLWRLFLRNFTNKVSFLNTDGSFEWVEKWFSLNYKPSYGSYMVMQDTNNSYRPYKKYGVMYNSNKGSLNEIDYYLAPNYGWYFKWYKNRIITLNKISEKGGGNDARIRDKIDIRIFGSKTILQNFLEEIKSKYQESKKGGMSIYCLSSFGDWEKQSVRDYVNFPILAPGKYDELKRDVDSFYSSYDSYRERGILYKRGYMFYGVPGTGKTSTIAALAFELCKDIYIMDMSAGVSNSTFISAIATIPSNGILVLEDMDCYSETNKRVKESGDDDKKEEGGILSLSTILNTLDGFATPTGLVFVITTNYKDKLDKALIRPGRIDKAVEFNAPSKNELKQLFIRLTGYELGFNSFFQQYGEISMAEAQTLILENQIC